MLTILSIIILIFSVIIHEIAHGYVALWFGDETALREGRLTLNPIKHIDPVGSIIFPLITSLMGFTFGWAKPVPYNPYNLKNRRIGELSIALAGPMSNILLAIIFGLIIRFTLVDGEIVSNFVGILSYIVLINLVLAIFNLIPVPPLDGSKILYFFLKNQYSRTRVLLEMYSPLFIFVALFVVWKIVSPIVPILYRLITGI
jgi:Zn-dependent protease